MFILMGNQYKVLISRTLSRYWCPMLHLSIIRMWWQIDKEWIIRHQVRSPRSFRSSWCQWPRSPCLLTIAELSPDRWSIQLCLIYLQHFSQTPSVFLDWVWNGIICGLHDLQLFNPPAPISLLCIFTFIISLPNNHCFYLNI